MNKYIPKYDIIRWQRGVWGGKVLGNFQFREWGLGEEKTYPQPVYSSGGGRHCSKPNSLNIGTDLIIGHFPDYNVIRRSWGVQERKFSGKFWV